MPRLLVNIQWAFVGNLIFALAKWGVLAIFTKTTDLASVGQFAFALAITAPIYAFCNFQLRGIQASDSSNEISAHDYLWFRVVASMIGLVAIIAIAFLSQDDHEFVTTIVLVGIWKAIESIGDIFYGYHQKHERMRTIAISLVIKGVAAVLVAIVVMGLGRTINATLVCLILAWGTVLIFFDFGQYDKLLSLNGEKTSWRPTAISVHRKLLVLGAPMGIVVLMHNLNLNIPRYAVEHYIGQEELAVFASLAYIIVAGTTIVGAIGQSALPRLARYRVSDIRAFRSLMQKIIALALVVGACGVAVSALAGPLVLRILYSTEYAKYNDVFILIMASATLLYLTTILGCGLTALRCFVPQAVCTFVAMLVIFAASVYLTPGYGLNGAAIAMGAGFLVHAALNFAALHDALRPGRETRLPGAIVGDEPYKTVK
jgi:O-antigen/teichoic acid export membrane protein